MNRRTIYIAIGVTVVILFGIWFFFFRSAQAPAGQTSGGVFGFGAGASNVQTDDGTNVVQTGATSAQRVFKIANGPVASATFRETFNPTTTVARYVMADSGHVLDVNIDVPGAVARPVSGTTIPGVTSAVWGPNGTSTVLQYSQSGTFKSVYVEFASTTAVSTPVHIQFLPNNIVSLALSPDRTHVAYLLTTFSGVDGYTANIDGTSAKKLFSFPLSQVTILWPSQNTLLVQTKSAVDVPGIVFSISAKTGGVTQLLSAIGVGAMANADLSKIIYQKASSNATGLVSYMHDTNTGVDRIMPFQPLPEKCLWNSTFSLVYCALSLTAAPTSYLNAWHQGLITGADSIFSYSIPGLDAEPVVTLGSGNNAPKEPIDYMSVSDNGDYLLFITRGDHSLWGVRLTQ